MATNEQILELITKMNADMQHGFDKVNDRFDKVNSDMQDGFDKVYSTIEEEFNNVYAEFKDIQMTLENETNKNIQLIAEGHFDLNRKLDDVMKVEKEKELMLIRLTRLENEIRRIKTRIEMG